MQAKVLEIRDKHTFIPALAVNINPSVLTVSSAPPTVVPDLPYVSHKEWRDASEAQRYLMRRCGYPCDGKPNILMTALSGDGRPATNDPYGWSITSRTFRVAHEYIILKWATLKDGDVVDVEFLLGESEAPKISERYTADNRGL